MDVWRLTRWLSGAVPVVLTGVHLLLAPVHAPAQSPSVPAAPAVLSPPRESLPLPVHNEATCAFCQAAAFAPYAATASDTLVLLTGVEHRTVLAQDVQVIHSGSTRPPRSRAPPTLRSI